MVKIKNVALSNKQLVTRYGTYVFDSRGIAEVPEDVAQKLSSLSGFIIIERITISSEDDATKNAVNPSKVTVKTK